ncbi:MAG: NAD-dependent epimerase/dehydratase family protein [Alphaproteobacteria bacterium]
MRLLVTGASGFIGAPLLVAACAAYGTDKVLAFSTRPTSLCPSILYRNPYDFGLAAEDLELLASVDVLIHAGAFIPKNGQEVNDLTGCNSNIAFTSQLLKLPMPRLRKILYLSTVDVYEPVELISESTPTLPGTLYGHSKLYCEKMVDCFAAQNNIASQILRISHVYGPGEEKFAKFMPKAIQDIITDKGIELWGDGSETRSFIYIGDVVTAILNAVALQDNVGVINIASAHSISIRQLAEQLIAISGKPVKIRIKECNVPSRSYRFDPGKMQAYLLARETDFTVGLTTEYNYIKSLG